MNELEMADKIFWELSKEDPDFAKELIKDWRDKMPNQYIKAMHIAKWGRHIVSKDFYERGLSFINYNNNPIEPFAIGDILNIAKKYIHIEEEPFYDYDLAMMTNILKGDAYNIISDIEQIVLLAIAFLSDTDYPFGDASERAYNWVECHIKNEEKNKNI